MKIISCISILLIVILISSCADKKHEEKKTGIVTTEVDYYSDGTTLKGFIAYDGEIKGKRPGVLIVHEWWGHNDYVRKRAKMIAELGYTALALDMFGDGKQANHPDDAGKFAMEVFNNMDISKAKFEAAMKLLKAQPTTDTEQIAAIGYCFGGGVVLHMARFGLELDAIVSFHGALQTGQPAEQDKVKGRLLVCNGADDPMTTPAQIEAFKKEMSDAGVHYKFINYPGAMHSFTNPIADSVGKKFNIPLAYNKEADEKSWAEMQALFSEVFK
jgi:dienelactone hydrolase